MTDQVHRSENDLLVFISSRMNDDLQTARDIAVQAVKSVEFGRPWAFEFSPASSESPDNAYLRLVRGADFVLWLVGSKTTLPVINEINEAIASGRRLLVFKLPSDQRDDSTMKLVDQVGHYVKWKDVSSVEELFEHIRKSMADEIIRGLRDPTPPTRRSKLRQEHRLSLSRCKDTWTSLGVDENVAREMAEERTVGDILDMPSPGVYAIVGTQGSGKTLAVERLFQHAVDKAIGDFSQPFPLFISARDLRETVRDYIERSLQGNAEPFDPRVLLIIDGLDELGSSGAIDIGHQAKVYADANRRATVIMTARLLPGLEVIGEEIALARLEEEQSVKLIAKVSGHQLKPQEMFQWPQSIRDVVHLPLFAVMIGSLLKDNPKLSFASPGEVIEQVTVRALKQVQGNSEELDRLLQELAVKSLDDGTRVRTSEITPVLAKQQLLLDSRLVEQSSDAVDFALPIFREWYAARALIEGRVSVGQLHQVSDRWIPSLSVVLNSEYDDIRSSLMDHLISSDPGLASLLLKEHSTDLLDDEGEILSLGAGESAGTKIRERMAGWKAGLGDLFAEIGPIGLGGEVASLGVDLTDQFLTTAWYAGESNLPPVVNLRDFDWPLRPSLDWPTISSSSLSRRIRDPFWWSCAETHSQLSKSLSKALHSSSLALCSRDARHELSWGFANDVMGRNRPTLTAFGIDETSATIRASREVINSYGANAVVGSLGGRSYTAKELEIVAEHLSLLANQGDKDIREPWPGKDLPFSPGYVWNNYSDQRLLERTIAIYSGALSAYTPEGMSDEARAALEKVGVGPEEMDDLLVRHTYLSAVIGMVVQASFGIDIRRLAESTPADLLQGRELYRATGLQGVLESDFFAWPNEVGGDPLLQTLARRVARFDWAEAPPDTAATLYETVIPPEERRQLGEYYTATWLVRAMIRELVNDPLKQRVLDPACGSGTFVAEAVSHFLAAAGAANWEPREVLNRLREAVTGIDVHPVAVHLARAAWTLAARPAISAASAAGYDASLSIPVYLGDALQLRFRTGDMFADNEITIQPGSAV